MFALNIALQFSGGEMPKRSLFVVHLSNHLLHKPFCVFDPIHKTYTHTMSFSESQIKHIKPQIMLMWYRKLDYDVGLFEMNFGVSKEDLNRGLKLSADSKRYFLENIINKKGSIQFDNIFVEFAIGLGHSTKPQRTPSKTAIVPFDSPFFHQPFNIKPSGTGDLGSFKIIQTPNKIPVLKNLDDYEQVISREYERFFNVHDTFYFIKIFDKNIFEYTHILAALLTFPRSNAYFWENLFGIVKMVYSGFGVDFNPATDWVAMCCYPIVMNTYVLESRVDVTNEGWLSNSTDCDEAEQAYKLVKSFIHCDLTEFIHSNRLISRETALDAPINQMLEGQDVAGRVYVKGYMLLDANIEGNNSKPLNVIPHMMYTCVRWDVFIDGFVLEHEQDLVKKAYTPVDGIEKYEPWLFGEVTTLTKPETDSYIKSKRIYPGLEKNITGVKNDTFYQVFKGFVTTDLLEVGVIGVHMVSSKNKGEYLNGVHLNSLSEAKFKVQAVGTPEFYKLLFEKAMGRMHEPILEFTPERKPMEFFDSNKDTQRNVANIVEYLKQRGGTRVYEEPGDFDKFCQFSMEDFSERQTRRFLDRVNVKYYFVGCIYQGKYVFLIYL